MKLLTVHMALDPASGGGNATRALELSRSLAALGVECAVVGARDGLERLDPAQLRGVQAVGLPTFGRRHPVPRGGFASLWRAVRHADVVLLMNHWTLVNAVAFVMARLAGRAHVICPGGALIDHGRSRLRKRVYNALVGRRIVRTAAAHIAVVAEERQDWQPYGVRPECVAVIPNGVTPSPRPADGESFRAAHGLGGAGVLLFLGRLEAIKGPDLLLGAFAACGDRLNGWHLVYAGSDHGMLQALQRSAAALGVADRVHFVGFLEHAEKAQALAVADLLVLPSRRETMSMVALEAAVAGVPVLVTDRCGLDEVEAAGAGWVVPASVEGLTRGLLAAAAAEPDGRRERGRRWRQRVSERYSGAAMAALHLRLFEELLGSRRSAG